MIQQEDIPLVNIYAPKLGAHKYINKILADFKGEINGNTVIVWDFKSSLASMNRFSNQKINKATTVTLNNTLSQMDLIVIYTTFHSKAAEYTFFSSAHGTF